jgi:hypothetical protein
MLLVLLLAPFAFALPQGSFSQNCWLLGGEDFVQGEVEISGASLKRSRRGYEEEGCQKPWVNYQESFSVLFLQEDALDLRMVEASYTPLTREVAEAFNLSGLCGFHNWKPKEKKDVTGQDCGDFYVPKVGEVVFTRLQVKGDAFSIGMESAGRDGTAANRRMVELEPEDFRQP